MLKTYRAKRDFTRTAEPAGQIEHGTQYRFMVQKHAATRLHYDFRLELDGVLKSWAVTRGPSTNPDDKRLAVRTEDHPLDYATFEGTIPKGEYGGGTVMLWDRGTWEPAPGKDPSRTIEEGHLHFTLHGERMKGEWLLIRLKPRPGEKKGRENWLLRKIEDGEAGGSDDLVSAHLTSISTGRTMAEIEAGKNISPSPSGEGAGGRGMSASKAKSTSPSPTQSGVNLPPAGSGRAGGATDPELLKGRGFNRPPPFRALQLATLVDRPPAGDKWLHEMKYDGYRTLIAVGGGAAKAYTRTGLDWSDRFPGIVAEAAGLDVASALIDGEAVVSEADGRTSFQALQAALKGDSGSITYVAFDLLELDGEDLTGLPLTERKDRLAALIGEGGAHIRYSDHITGKGEALFDTFCGAGLEGVVSKRADSPYVGRRSDSWLKSKCTRRQEFVIVGWTPSDKTRGFRSLLLGVHEDGKLRYAGKAGTGFSGDEMERLLDLMKPLERTTPTVEAPRAAVRGAHWVTPKLVAEIAFTETTGDGVLRHPSYLGLREDKAADDVVVEAPAPAKAPKVAAPLVKISNPDRVIFPESKITKGQLADYYAAVAPIMLPWTARRPISLVRCPQGRARKCFFQKHDAGVFGDAVKQIPIAEKDGGEEAYLYVEDAVGLVTCVQMGTIEFHGWGALIDDVEKADRLVFDLDPDEGLEFDAVKSAATHVRDLLAEIGLATFPMVTGGKGVHVVAPLAPQAEWPAVKDFAHRFATVLAQQQPDRFTDALSKAKRKGRIFVDYLRNQRGSTAVMPYSARARDNAPVAVPLSWDELHDLDCASHWHIGDADALLKRAGSRDLNGWGVADQVLPDL